MKFSNDLAKVLFVLSTIVLVFLFGLTTGYKHWPPTEFLDKAAGQARNLGIWPSLFFTDKPPSKTLPKVYNRSGVNIKNPQKMQPGLTLITSLWENKSGDLEVGAKLIDKKGQTVHKWLLDRDKLFVDSDKFERRDPKKSDFQGTYLFPNGDLLLNLEYVGTVRVDACGEVKWRLPELNHHSIHRAEDGTFWIPAVHDEKRTGSQHYPDGFPGLDGKPVWIDRIIQISENGKILDDINVLDVLYKNGLERFIPKTLGGKRPTSEKVPADITHINDVEPLSSDMSSEYPIFEAGDLLVSARNIQLVFVFDPKTLEVKWHASEPFIYQHDPDFIGGGWIGIFDNNYDLGGRTRGKMLGGSQIVALKPHTGTEKLLFPTEHSEPFYTHIRGKWQMLENGNMLLTEEEAGRIIEVAPDGSTVWEWIHKPFGKSRVPKVTKGTRYDLTKEQVASWPCSSVSSSENTQQEGEKNYE